MDSGGTDGMASEEQGISGAVAVVVAIAAGLCAAVVLVVVFHWMGWTLPWVGWLLAKGAVKVGVAGAAGLVGGVAWLRQQRGQGAKREGGAGPDGG
ncbi:hypothetical protein ACIGZJ_28190 [Kitasatospora sp. NPDC052868]|uniref:hypothetical protein n=1 Tax=Kitasatospora sp. NPDC052868 TaxID=3364060 RepID=UPI0037C75A95